MMKYFTGSSITDAQRNGCAEGKSTAGAMSQLNGTFVTLICRLTINP